MSTGTTIRLTDFDPKALQLDPYQFFCGELSFCHRLPFDRSSLTHWRQRLGEAQLQALVQESLSVAHKTEALATRDLEWVLVAIGGPPMT